jgi:hypothetical protein
LQHFLKKVATFFEKGSNVFLTKQIYYEDKPKIKRESAGAVAVGVDSHRCSKKTESEAQASAGVAQQDDDPIVVVVVGLLLPRYI